MLLLVLLAATLLISSEGMTALKANAQTGGPQTATPLRVGTYWLNFSFVDSSGHLLTSFSFQFYVNVNATARFGGFAASPEIVPKGGPNPFYAYASVNYSDFAIISGVFQSYKESNGSSPDTALLYTGSPEYGPANNHYYFILACGFPCIRDGAFVEANSTGRNSYVGWSYYYRASDLEIYLTNLSVYEMQALSITVNMTVAEVGNNPNSWAFDPNVDIAGAQYQSINTSTGLTYVIQTGIQPQLGLLSYLLILAASTSVVIVSFGLVRRRHRNHQVGEGSPHGTSPAGYWSPQF
jgi:hypothetical protein